MPKMNITVAIVRPKMKVIVVFKVKAEPIAPMTPPKTKNEAMRPPWNKSWGLNRSPSLANVADIESNSPPTTAMQVESDATTPITNAVPYETEPAFMRFTSPAF